MDLHLFRAALWEIFKGPLLVLAVPVLPLFLICLTAITVMIFREFKNK